MSRFRRGATPERKRSCREVGPGLLAALPEGEEVVKIAIIMMLAGLGYLFLSLCFYVMYRSGSTEGLSDPSATVVVVEHRDRLARFGVENLEAALGAHSRRIVVADSGETTDDLVRDMIEVLTSMCARLYGRRGARNRAMRAVTAAKAEPGQVA